MKPKPTAGSAEVSAVTRNGLWLLVNDMEYFLDFQHFPWFKDAPAEKTFQLEWDRRGHLSWPDLDIDLELESIQNLEKYPLIYR